MTSINQTDIKGNARLFLDNALLFVCLSVLALRTTFTESPSLQSASVSPDVNSGLYTLILSTILISLLLIWLIFNICSRCFSYTHAAGIEIGISLLITGSVIAFFAASNKRAAINQTVITIAPFLAVVLLVQLLNSPEKIRLVLIVIASLGIVCTYECANQYFVTNQITLQQYQSSPESVLKPLGIEPNSFQHMMLEHRISTKDVRGFFSTSNSAGSFLILAAFAAVALSIEKFKSKKSFIFSVFATTIIIFGLALTHSKGAIASCLFAIILFFIMLRFGRSLASHKKTVLISIILLFIILTVAVISYGLTHNTLPGGVSMLVRWQYWCASAQMYAAAPFTGIGPGNFGLIYTQYKPPAALESVSDPHNFFLSILTQYGPIGLIGFLALIFAPLWNAFSAAGSLPSQQSSQASFPAKLSIFLFVCIAACFLIVRPFILPIQSPGTDITVILYTAVILYIVPIVAFLIGFALFAANASSFNRRDCLTLTALLCAAVGVLIHNLIDFAIFEPAVLTTFAAVLACIISITSYSKQPKPFIIKPPLLLKIVTLVASAALVLAYCHCILVPSAVVTAKTEQAFEQPRSADTLLAQAASADHLNSEPFALNGKICLTRGQAENNSALLKKARDLFSSAISRNKADFKNYENLAAVYTALAGFSTGSAKTDSLNNAFTALQTAIRYYPGCERLHFKLAKIAESLQKPDIAIMEYKEAVTIEDLYQKQFRVMYPSRKMFSRLGEQNYLFALEKIKTLSAH